MKRFFILWTVVLAGGLLTSCEYDDDELWNKVNGLQEQVDANTRDIATLSALVEALNQGKVITAVDQTETGYRLTFSDGSSIDITNGESGDSLFESIVEENGMIVVTLTDGRVIRIPIVELRVLTFEDTDAKFTPYTITGYDGTSYYNHTVASWSDLIDTPEYGGPLAYGDMGYGGEMRGCDYNWYDQGNTFLASEFPNNYGSRVYWGGGHVISHYAAEDYTTYGTYNNQMTVFGEGETYDVTRTGGHNGSAHFAMHYGYKDGTAYNMTEHLPYFYFKDGVARVIDHMWVNNSTYAISCYMDGNGLTAKIGAEDWVKVVATGYGEDGSTSSAEFFLCNGPEHIITEWTKWDLSSLGKVLKVEFNITGSSDNGYGFSQPAYFAYDDVAVRF